jgi:putative nucleotidyltransferase with HDIG domain
MDQRTLRDAVKEYAKQLAQLVNEIGLYPPTHPHIQFQLEKTITALQPLHVIMEVVVFTIIEGYLAFDGIPLYELRAQTDKIVPLCQNKKIRRICVSRGVTPDHLLQFALLLQSKIQVPDGDALISALREQGIASIRADSLISMDESAALDVINGKQVYGATVEANKLVYKALQNGEALPLEVVDQMSRNIAEMISRDRSSGLALALLRDYDDYTFTHSANVAILTVAVATFLVDDPRILQRLARAAILHDIGKTRIPLKILNKPERLDPEEWHIMQQHPKLGVIILEEEKQLDRLPILIAAQHHMKYDHTGYPNVAGMEKLHPFSLIVNICDIYDAITSRRAYKNPLPPDRALAIMSKLIGSDFYPQFFKLFLQTVGVYPPGSFLRLNTGEIGIVQKVQPMTLLQPEIKLLTSPAGSLRTEPEILNLAAAGETRHIAALIAPDNLGLNPLDFMT